MKIQTVYELAPFSFIEILELIGIIFGTIMLLITVFTYFKNTKIKQAEALATLSANFQRDRQAELDNPIILRIRAEEQEIEIDEYVKKSLGSFSINRAYLLFLYHKHGLMTKERREADIRDMREMFAGTITHEHWQRAQYAYPQEFQDFVAENIL